MGKGDKKMKETKKEPKKTGRNKKKREQMKK